MQGLIAGIAPKWAGVLLSIAVSLGMVTVTVPSAATESGVGATSTISLGRTIRTTPFKGSTVSMKDNEGTVYVARDNSLWLSDDEGQRLFEVNATTGALKRMVTAKRLATVHRVGGSKAAGRARTRDLEGLAYDIRTDRLYAFAGSDCKPSTANCRWKSLPTAYRFTRKNGQLRPQSYQPLPRRTQIAAASWHPTSDTLYVGAEHVVRTYAYQRNTFGPGIDLPGPEVLGMSFTGNGRALFVTHGNTRLSRIAWQSKSLVWTVDLSKLGMRDARGVTQVKRRLFISDGFDHRAADSPLRYAVFVLKLN